MTPEEELKKLNHLIRQYETVYQTTKTTEQRERVGKQLSELRRSRQMIVDVNLIDAKALQQAEALEEFKHLHRLLDGEGHRTAEERLEPLTALGSEPTLAQEEVFNLMLYVRFFRSEFLPFLAEKRLKLDFKFSRDRSSFYGKFSELERKLDDFRAENVRLSNGSLGREIELEMQKRLDRLKGNIKSDAARFYRSIVTFCEELAEDAKGGGVKCLNGSEEITFEDIEGKHLLEGRQVRDALALLSNLAAEIVAYLKVPEEH